MTPERFLRLAVDPVRLAVLGAAATKPVDVEDLAGSLGVSRKKVLAAVAALRASGLITLQGRLDRGVLRAVAADMPAAEPVAAEIVDGPWTAEEAEVLARFFEGTRLTSIPAHRGKRLVVLERLAQEFEPGLRYPERQVNFVLQLFHPDHAALRRYLVDEGLLTRADGVYWRTGGRFADGG